MGISEIQIVDVFLKDLKALQEISRRTFNQSFAAMNTPENMKFFLNHHYSDEKLSSELQNPGSRFYFAKNNEQILGYLKINQVIPKPFCQTTGLEIERIYVDEAFKGRGIGKYFIEKQLI